MEEKGPPHPPGCVLDHAAPRPRSPSFFQRSSTDRRMTVSSAPLDAAAFDEAVRTVRFLAIDAVEKAESGHPGTPMGLAGIALEIFTRHLVHNPKDPSWPGRDRFVLSCGHASMLLYSLLHLSGYDLSLDDLKAFRQWGSKTPGHPEFGHTPGVETTTGPLGQGIGNAVGLALAAKLGQARAGAAASLLDYRVFVICSDGDMMEGVAYEAASLAGHLELDNLVVVYDDNQITIDGKTDLAFSEDVGLRFEGLGWAVQRVDGHDPEAVHAAIEESKKADRPAIVVARTKIGFGSPGKEGKSSSHGSPLGKADAEATRLAASWSHPPFFVPDGVRTTFLAVEAKNYQAYEAWQARVVQLSSADKALFDSVLARKIPGDIYEQLLATLSRKDDATRNHGGRVLQEVAKLVPALLGGSADLAGSVKTTINGGGDVNTGAFAGRNLHFGVREHGMGSVLNGLALSGLFVPYGSTFLIFGDYMRPPMRLAGLMNQQVIYVFSHDSVFLGEDGPTHQPVEQLWTMRMVPNLDVFRPADALETAAAWAYAMERTTGPTVLSLTRHTVPELTRPVGFDPRSVLDGAYVLQDEADPDLVLIGTGSEVSVLVEAAVTLRAKGKRVRIVSMPCVDAFLRLSADKQATILPPGVRRASLELGVTLPWKAITGLDGINLGIDRFGASAPWERLQEEFGVTPRQVAERLLAAL